MARGRMLSKSLSCSRRFNALSESQNGLAEFTQLLFALLIPHSDDFGRMPGDPFSVKMTVFPASPRALPEFTEALHALHDSELITVYQGEHADIWLQVNKFDDHQIGLHKRTKSLIPDLKKANSRKFPEIPGNSGSRARAEENRTELNRREEKGISDPSFIAKERERDSSTSDEKPVSLLPAAPPDGTPNQDAFLDDMITKRAAQFIERYQVLYLARRNGARYAVKPVRDYAAAVTLCRTWDDDARLDKLAVVFLTTDHKFAEEGSRTIPQFLALASWCDSKLVDWENTHGRTESGSAPRAHDRSRAEGKGDAARTRRHA